MKKTFTTDSEIWVLKIYHLGAPKIIERNWLERIAAKFE